MKNKTISCVFHQMQVNFILNPMDSNIMINATQMAKIFDKRVDHFTKSEHAQRFISQLELTPFGVSSEPLKREEILKSNNGNATFMHRLLALKFAAWLDVEFELWIYEQIDGILFGNYKKHWDAHTRQEVAKENMILIKEQMLLNATNELSFEYFRNEEIVKETGKEKTKALREQIHLFNYLKENN